ncbi:CRISPR-associated endoribonuclease Cas2 1 [Capsulimonas corticalis]|uniref:CRISPR-associated endoribonuclease Cas2 n=1 Tax=Capsulimonas corticalis TaxID=2219043 RepID=A0A402D635_9BACT|nr:CRISPR-associated endoribonuclease Cas2 1 [Capsulimonas corticalis]
MSTSVRSRYLIAYDITDDAKRTKLSKMLQDYGDRVQKSVFEADLTSQDIQAVMRKAAVYVGKEDSLRIYPMCANCRKGVHSLGQPLSSPTATFCIV